MSGKAESRLIYNSISTSERVSSLVVKGALLYTWLITHCDTQGRMQGKPTVVNQLVAPFLEEITAEDVDEVLGQMQQQRLIKRYEDDTGRPLLQVLAPYQDRVKLRRATHESPPIFQLLWATQNNKL